MPEKKFVSLEDATVSPTEGQQVFKPSTTAPTDLTFGVGQGKKFIKLGDAIQDLKSTPNPGAESTATSAVHSEIPLLGSPLPLIGAAGGEALAGPAGGAVGNALGNYVLNKLKNAYPDPSMPETASHAMVGGAGDEIESLLNGLMFYGAGKVPGLVYKTATKAGNTEMMQSLITKLFKGKGTAADTEAAMLEGFKPTVGQATQSKGAQLLERNFAGGAKMEIENAQQVRAGERIKELRAEFNPLRGAIERQPTSTYAQPAQAEIIRNQAAAKGAVTRAYENFEKNHELPNSQKFNMLTGYEKSKALDANGKPVMIPKTEEVSIPGPIFTTNASKFAAEIKPDIDAYVQGNVFEHLPEWERGKIAKIKDAVDNLTTMMQSVGPDGNPANIPVKKWQTVKQMRTDINDDMGGKLFPNMQEGGLKKLSALLEKDIEETISTSWKNGPTALKDLEKANAANRYMRETFNPEVMQKVFGPEMDPRKLGDQSELFNEAYKSQEKTRRFMAALGPQESHQMKGDYFDNQIYPKLFDPASKKFNSSDLLRQLDDPNSVIRDIYTAKERAGLLRFAKAIRTVNPDEKLSGNYSLAYRQGLFVLSLAAGVGQVASGKDMSVGAETAALGLGASFAARQFTKRILLDPQAAGIATQLLKAPAASQAARDMQKQLLTKLRGLQVIVNTPIGKQEGVVDDNGKIKINDKGRISTPESGN